MSPGGVVVVAEQMRGEIADISLEALACGREVADAAGWSLDCLILTDDCGPFKALPLATDRTIIVEDPALGAFNPEAQGRVLTHLLGDLSPRLVLLGNTGVGMDLAGPLSVALNAVIIGGCTGLTVSDGSLLFTSTLCGGKVVATSEVTDEMAIALLMAGSFPRERGMTSGVPEVEVRGLPEPLGPSRVTFREYVEPEAEDIDLTKVPILVAAGRGIGSEEKLETVEALAAALGGAVCASRPVVDQGWLPKTRQVGRSGAIVKPRLYLALGISGAPEHMEGMRDADLIIAVNTDEEAPIFDVAQYGSTHDLLDLVPVLTKRIQALRGG
jgi:electron transfer flavoprotein alpha subunit